MEGIMDACKVLQAKGREGRSRASGADMSFVTLEDATGLFELVLFPRQHQRFSHLFTHMGPYRVQGVVTEAWDALSLEVHYVEAVG
jgi:DNA polymerase III alpha subunit